MTPNDLNQIWQDALNDAPCHMEMEALRLRGLALVRAKRRWRIARRTASLAIVIAVAIAAWQVTSIRQAGTTIFPSRSPMASRDSEVPEVVPRVVNTSPVVTPEPGTAVRPQPPDVDREVVPSPRDEANQIVVMPVPLNEFISRLPNHGYMTIENNRGRFLVIVDHETGQTTTRKFSNNDNL